MAVVGEVSVKAKGRRAGAWPRRRVDGLAERSSVRGGLSFEGLFAMDFKPCILFEVGRMESVFACLSGLMREGIENCPLRLLVSEVGRLRDRQGEDEERGAESGEDRGRLRVLDMGSRRIFPTSMGDDAGICGFRAMLSGTVIDLGRALPKSPLSQLRSERSFSDENLTPTPEVGEFSTDILRVSQCSDPSETGVS